MRHALILLLTASAAQAWEFSPTPICTLTHTEDTSDIAVTYDFATGLYAIDITAAQAWPAADAFSIAFAGGRGGLISTARHSIDGATLSVSDIGFGNVLDGLEFNTSATAFTQTAAVEFSLEGAAGPVREFRACAAAPAV